ncbi:Hypothetical predicted protein, partial [Olea europaea subsp. europaea]
ITNGYGSGIDQSSRQQITNPIVVVVAIMSSEAAHNPHHCLTVCRYKMCSVTRRHCK